MSSKLQTHCASDSQPNGYLTRWSKGRGQCNEAVVVVGSTILSLAMRWAATCMSVRDVFALLCTDTDKHMQRYLVR